MNIYENMAYKAPSSMAYMAMTSSDLRAAEQRGDAEAAAELARRRANRDERGTYGRYLKAGETGAPREKAVSAFKVAASEAHRAMAAADLKKAAEAGDSAAAAELERRAHNRKLRSDR
jgi:hypothetical protein